MKRTAGARIRPNPTWLRQDHLAAGLALYLGIDVGAEDVSEEPVVVLAEDDRLRADLLRRVHDRAGWVTGPPHQVRLETGRGKPFAGLSQVRGDLRWW